MKKKKFKFTWGHGMALALSCFIIFILSFLVRFHYLKGNSLDLVTEDYYNKGLKFQQHYDALENTQKLVNKPSIELGNQQLIIAFPADIEPVNGKLGIYRPSDKRLDHEFPLQLTDNQMVLGAKAFEKGKYDINLYWEDLNGTPYFIQKEIFWN